MKCLNRQEFVNGGSMASDKPRRALRSLLLGYSERGELIFAGTAGTGFDLKTGHDLVARLKKLERHDSPFASFRVSISAAPIGRIRGWPPRRR